MLLLSAAVVVATLFASVVAGSNASAATGVTQNPALSMSSVHSNVSTGSGADGCAACCAPGGSCDSAFKTQIGVCCGLIGDTPYCCPSAGSSFGSAQCFREGSVFRCRQRGGNASPGRRFPSDSDYHDSGTVSVWWSLWCLLGPLACLAGCSYVVLRRRLSPQPVYLTGVALVPLETSPSPPPATGFPVMQQAHVEGRNAYSHEQQQPEGPPASK